MNGTLPLGLESYIEQVSLRSSCQAGDTAASGRSSEDTGTPSAPKFKSCLANGRYMVALRGQVLLREAGLEDRESDRWVLPEAAGSGGTTELAGRSWALRDVLLVRRKRVWNWSPEVGGANPLPCVWAVDGGWAPSG